jgi:hypothetical protein
MAGVATVAARSNKALPLTDALKNKMPTSFRTPAFFIQRQSRPISRILCTRCAEAPRAWQSFL